MKFKKILFILLILNLLSACVSYEDTKKSREDLNIQSFHSSGFALIYDTLLYEDSVIKTKMDNDKLHVIHRSLKKNTIIEISNPKSLKKIKVKVFKKEDYPTIFNVLITKKIANILELDTNNPFIEIAEIKKNKTFIANKVVTEDEEKEVSTRVVLKSVEVDDISSQKQDQKSTEKEESFIIIIGDFYNESTASNLKQKLISDGNIDKLQVKRIKKNQFRLLSGPFENFNTLKSAYIGLNNLGFHELDINKY